ncbi:MAG: spore coat associated protein CotJA [Ruminococcaceae bacterium]|nr:spore coat associated protein CotJA [Oscillospiraceae bacterium]
MVYAPIQEFDGLYDLDKALMSGTVFKELDLPFMGMTVTKGGNCRG